jgi:hypothetical protein
MTAAPTLFLGSTDTGLAAIAFVGIAGTSRLLTLASFGAMFVGTAFAEFANAGRVTTTTR